METTYGRDRDGKPRAETRIPLGFDNRELHITTCKHPWKPQIDTDAYVYVVTPSSKVHAFGGAGADFGVTVECEKKRATEAAIRAQHERILVNVDVWVAAARAHYAARVQA
jgi:hypothetical protein